MQTAGHTGSLSTLSSLHDGYIALSTCITNDETTTFSLPQKASSFKSKSAKKHSRRNCFCSFLSLFHRFLIAILHLLCIKASYSVDNESLLTVEHRKESEGLDHVTKDVSDQSSFSCLFEKETNKVLCNKSNSETPQELISESNTRSMPQYPDCPTRGHLIASKGKDQLNATKVTVSESMRQLQVVKEDVLSIRDDIQTAKKLFQEIEKGIQDYKWDALDRNPWICASNNHGGFYCMPSSSSKNTYSQIQQIYRDRLIFLEEMKFHFKWNHGIIL